MKVVIVGHGGREAAIAWRLSQSPGLEALVVTGHNPGWPEGVEVRAESKVQDQVAVARSVGADLVIVGPEGPLASGLADGLQDVGIPCFGPRRAAARLESSKAFAKDVMAAVGVPTAAAVVLDRNDPASVAAGRARLAKGDVVVKVDGLAAGKGVFVCRTGAEALAAMDGVWSGRFGAAANRVVLEDRLEGPEVSLFGLTDGDRVVALPSAQDHKRLGDGDSGPNTGGMGAYSPCPLVPREQAQELVERFHQPVIRELDRRGVPFRGVLFAGLMLTPDGPRVLEYNVRFGDPECQVLMALWQDDPLPWLLGAATGRLPPGRPEFADAAACCVVLASRGYPLSSEKGVPIPEPSASPGVVTFQAGTHRGEDGVLRTHGGRVLGITGVGPDLQAARDRAYAALPGWEFPGSQHRQDIGASAV
ncbi:MAG: phosphoribosylamine--glycine ligase [Myxococcota bacterium]|jgi:phosphoribosylamine--glycine ligase